MLRCDNKNTPTPPQAINNDRSLKGKTWLPYTRIACEQAFSRAQRTSGMACGQTFGAEVPRHPLCIRS